MYMYLVSWGATTLVSKLYVGFKGSLGSEEAENMYVHNVHDKHVGG